MLVRCRRRPLPSLKCAALVSAAALVQVISVLVTVRVVKLDLETTGQRCRLSRKPTDPGEPDDDDVSRSRAADPSFLKVLDRGSDTLDPRTCVPVDLAKFGVSGASPFSLCPFPVGEDHDVSHRIRTGGAWEVDTTKALLKLLKAASELERRAVVHRPAVLLDLGANLGSQAVAVAGVGYRTWAVEPEPNIASRLYEGARASNLSSRVTVVNNALDSERRTISFWSEPTNRGASSAHRNLMNISGTREYAVDTVLLADVVADVLAKSDSDGVVPIVLKVDIQLAECRTFVGSPDVFLGQLCSDGNIGGSGKYAYVPYIAMEWEFTGFYDEALNAWCPPATLRAMVELLVGAGYHPLTLDGKLLDATEAAENKWPVFVMMVWQHRDAPHAL